MELKDILDKEADQVKDDFRFQATEIRAAIQNKAQQDFTFLLRHQRIGLLLNMGILVFFISIYWWRPIPDLLLPLALISACFLWIISNILRYFQARKQIDLTLPLKQVLQMELQLTEQLNRRNKQYVGVLFSTSLLGGFLLGLLLRDWTLSRLLQTPAILVIMIALTGIGYWASTHLPLKGISHLLSKKYHQKQRSLKEQLQYLEEE